MVIGALRTLTAALFPESMKRRALLQSIGLLPLMGADGHSHAPPPPSRAKGSRAFARPTGLGPRLSNGQVLKALSAAT